MNIYEFEKIYFSNLQSNLDKLLNHLKNNEIKNKNILQKILEFNSKINDIELFINDLKYLIIKEKTNENNLFLENKLINNDSNNFIDSYDKNNLVMKKFLPYILFYRLYLDIK